MDHVVLEDGKSRRHRQALLELLSSAEGSLRIVTPYVTDSTLIQAAQGRDIRLLTSVLPMDLVSGATSIETLGWMIKAGIECRALPERPHLHAKVYIFGESHALITSANLTSNALNHNIEAGITICSTEVSAIKQWYDRLWEAASPLTIERLSEYQCSIQMIRREFAELAKRAQATMKELPQGESSPVIPDRLEDLLVGSPRVFICNTNRRRGERTPTGGFVHEEAMRIRGMATAWEDFRYPNHMTQVRTGDAILMFAKGIGIIAVGVATREYETLSPGAPSRLYHSSNEPDTTEWRVPAEWLTWDEANACPWEKPSNATFLNVSGPDYRELRERVRAHFLRQPLRSGTSPA